MPPWLRWPSHWPKPRISLVLAWGVAIIFIWQWVWAYDACRVSDAGGSRFICLAGSFYGVVIGWGLAFWVTIVALAERLLP
jgi:hypothetical protein